MGLLRQQFQFKGFGYAILSVLRSDALGDYTEEYTVLGSQRRDMMLLWGTEDKEVTPPMIATVRHLVPGIEYHSISGVGHGIVFQRPKETHTFVNDFLTR